jgi:hypothetical protein
VHGGSLTDNNEAKWNKKADTADVALMGDRWLQSAIQEQALQPFVDADHFMCVASHPFLALLSYGAIHICCVSVVNAVVSCISLCAQVLMKVRCELQHINT